VTFSIMILSIPTLCHYAECQCAECCNLFIVMLNTIMLSVIMLSVIVLSVIMLSVIMLNVVMLSVVAPLKPLFGIHGWWHLPGWSKDANPKFGFLDSKCL
jgi:hypothetical protein